MKTYLFPDVLTAVLLNRQQLKRILASALTLGISLALLANTAHYTYVSIDTNRVFPNGADQANNSPIHLTTQVAGNISNDQFSLPLVMTAFNAILEDNKVSITWTTGLEKRLNYFVIERSSNGVDFKEAALVFAVTTSSAKQNYSFIDAINVHGNGLLFYRIRIVDINGRYQNSAVKLIRLGDAATVTHVEAYPNPVVNEVRITIPSKWQNQQVRYEVYNISGRLVKRMTNSNANQTEVLNMQDCGAGMYIIRTSTDLESQSQSIVKK
jgi:hypothetical protein